jgi:pyrroloquinoline-quinone synthase
MIDEAFRERLLTVMDRKHHRAWPAFTRPGLTRDQLAIHFANEWGTYVRDFPVLLARVLGHGPPDDVRRPLAENIYEEQTGGFSGGVPHPELFLRMIDGLGIARSKITDAELVPEARAYRAFLDHVCRPEEPWVVGCAVLTIFVEGSVHERAELAGTRAQLPVEEAVDKHPMVAFYGCPREAMGLVRAHRAVEGGHRKDAWQMVLAHANGHQNEIVAAVERACDLWHAYRDDVCRIAAIT